MCAQVSFCDVCRFLVLVAWGLARRVRTVFFSLSLYSFWPVVIVMILYGHAKKTECLGSEKCVIAGWMHSTCGVSSFCATMSIWIEFATWNEQGRY